MNMISLETLEGFRLLRQAIDEEADTWRVKLKKVENEKKRKKKKRRSSKKPKSLVLDHPIGTPGINNCAFVETPTATAKLRQSVDVAALSLRVTQGCAGFNRGLQI
jgi:hypothetical protein